MQTELFILSFAFGLSLLFAWAFRTLPREHWQIMAAVPIAKTAGGAWQGVNLTYYGFFVATSNVLAVLVLVALLGTLGVPLHLAAVLVLAVFALCWPAARWIARLVEKKQYTFTVGGAVFTGVVVAPWLIAGLNWLLRELEQTPLPALPVLAALTIAYAFGESLGRLACISFGCCYGKRVTQLAPRWQRLFARLSFEFSGAMKKAAYAGGLEGVRVVPIQALTACVYALLALGGTYLFLRGWFTAALLLPLTLTQLWRFGSELLRADERGPSQRISAYQVMALSMIGYVALASWWLATPAHITPDLGRGLRTLWQPAVLLLSQALWLTLFWHTGRSMVTGAQMTFFVQRERI
jgi:uncharacterized membrane protein YccF (DUF307 family)